MTTTTTMVETATRGASNAPSSSSLLSGTDPNESRQSQIHNISLTESFESTEASILPTDPELLGAARPEEAAAAVTAASSSLVARDATRGSNLKARISSHPRGLPPYEQQPAPPSSTGGKDPPPPTVLATPPRKRLFFAKSPTSTPTRASSPGGGGRSPGRHLSLRPSFLRIGKDRGSPLPPHYHRHHGNNHHYHLSQQEESPPSTTTTTSPEPSSLQREGPTPRVAECCSSSSDAADDVDSTGTSTTGEGSSLAARDRADGPSGEDDDDDRVSYGDGASAADTAQQHPYGGEASPSRLFRDEMDIVAFQEWPLRHRQRTPAVETIATRLGRSPVRVTFRSHPEAFPDPVHYADPERPIDLQARIPTGIPPMPRQSDSNGQRRRQSGGCDAGPCQAESILSAIESTFQQMMCID